MGIDMEIDYRDVSETWSIVEIRDFISANSEKLSSTELSRLYDIICNQKLANAKLLDKFITSKNFDLAYKALAMQNVQIQDLSIAEFINEGSLVRKYAGKILDNMIVIRQYLGRQANSRKIAKIRWNKVREESSKILPQH